MSTAIAFLVLLAATLLFWGVGVAIQRLLGRAKPMIGPAAIGIGVAVVVGIGGFLNLAHLAYPLALWIFAGIALVLTTIELRRAAFAFPLERPAQFELAAAVLVISAAILFTIATQLPPSVFNFHDDFEKYFAHPVRMLETGTLAGSPLSALGSETLGGQAFLHGFVLAALPIPYINGVDAVFGLFALMLVAAAAGWRRFSWFPGAALGPLLIAAINPQYVNVSGLYLGALLMATATVLLIGDGEIDAPAPFILGLIYAALVAIKSTFGLFPLLHLPLAIFALRKTLGSARESLKWTARTVMWTAVGLLPWFALYLPNYLAHGGFPRAAVPPGNEGTLHLFSTRPLYYGGAFSQYTALTLMGGAVAIAALMAARRNSAAEAQRRLLGVFAGAASGVLAYAVIVVALGPAVNGYAVNLRYAIPYLLGTAVMALVEAPSLSPELPRWLTTCAPAVAALVIVVVFVPSAERRDRQAVRFGSILGFSELADSPAYAAYNRYSLSGSASEYVRGFQNQVPAGEPLVAWIGTPFWLDYKRNPIMDADAMGISSPWARIPTNAHYVLWQYRGFGIRSEGDYLETMRGPGEHERNIAAQDLAFGNYLSRLAQSSKVITSDGQMVLFEIPSPSSR